MFTVIRRIDRRNGAEERNTIICKPTNERCWNGENRPSSVHFAVSLPRCCWVEPAATATLYAGIHKEKEIPTRTNGSARSILLEITLNNMAAETPKVSDTTRPLGAQYGQSILAPEYFLCLPYT